MCLLKGVNAAGNEVGSVGERSVEEPHAVCGSIPLAQACLGAAGSLVGLGCWQLGETDWGNVDDAEAMEILNTAADVGVTFFDTADVYGNGRSERLIGRFLRERPAGFFVAEASAKSAANEPGAGTPASCVMRNLVTASYPTSEPAARTGAHGAASKTATRASDDEARTKNIVIGPSSER